MCTPVLTDKEIGFEILLAAVGNQDAAALENFTTPDLEAACTKARELLLPKPLPTAERAESVGYMALDQASDGLRTLPLGGKLDDAIYHMGMGQKIYIAHVVITQVNHRRK